MKLLNLAAKKVAVKKQKIAAKIASSEEENVKIQQFNKGFFDLGRLVSKIWNG